MQNCFVVVFCFIDVKIHDLKHSMDERVRLFDQTYMFFGPFLNSLSARHLVGDEAVDSGDAWGTDDIPYSYQGNVVTDVYLALSKYSNNWDYLEKMLVGKHILVPWSEGNTQLPTGTLMACNMDTMIHSGKGTTGLRLDGVKHVSIDNVEIYNLHDVTPSGETVCGEYTEFDPDTGGGHLAQQLPMQKGFSGNKVQAITFNSAYDITLGDMSIHDLESDTGLVTGLTLWPANQITFSGDFIFKNFQSSTKLDTSDINSQGMTGPNWDHYSCAMFMHESYYKTTNQQTYTTEITFDDDVTFGSCNIVSSSNDDNSWKTDCYLYSDQDGIEYHDIDESSDIFAALRSSNNAQSCEDLDPISTNDINQPVLHIDNPFSEGDGNATGHALLYGGIAFAAFVLVIFLGLMYTGFDFCPREHEISYADMMKSRYGTLEPIFEDHYLR